MNPKDFFAELRRRNIYRVAAAYAVVVVAHHPGRRPPTFPVLEIPSWCVRLVIVLLMLGFPIALDSRLGLRANARRDQAGR